MRYVISSEWPGSHLLQCYRLPDKNSRDISRHNYLQLFAVFQTACLFCGLFLAKHVTEFCRTLVGKNWARVAVR
jgi:hypothetical protein